MKNTDEQKEMLEVVSESGEVIGLEERKLIHEKGLLHKEIHVLFVTSDGGIIFQHREKDKTSWPDALDATAGGHVDPGEDVLGSAIREAREETGLDIKPKDLIFVGNIKSCIYETKTEVINNVLRSCYGYLFTGDMSDLKIEKGKIISFVKYKYRDLASLSEIEKQKFIPERLEAKYMEIYAKIFKEFNLTNNL